MDETSESMKYDDPTLRESGAAIGCLAMLALCIAVVVVPILYFADIVRLPATQEPLPVAGDIQEMQGELGKVSSQARRIAGVAARPSGAADGKERDPAGGASGKRRAVSESPWTSYEIVEQQERGSRLVAGRKQAITYAVMLKPRKDELPTQNQLEDLSYTLRSDAHHATYIYFYAPGMDTKRGAWATAQHSPGGTFELKRFDNTLPAKFRN